MPDRSISQSQHYPKASASTSDVCGDRRTFRRRVREGHSIARRNDMTRLITAVALATMFASPVLAKTFHHQAGGYVQTAPAYRSDPSVVEGGRYIGRDPDANVRSELYRDYGSSEGAY
jgi:hypothetical protein